MGNNIQTASAGRARRLPENTKCSQFKQKVETIRIYNTDSLKCTENGNG